MRHTSLCHRPRNCNFSNLCGRCKSLAPEIVSWFRFHFAESLAPPAKGSLRSPFASGGLSRLRRSRFALDFPRSSGARIWVNCLESSLWQRLASHKKYGVFRWWVRRIYGASGDYAIKNWSHLGKITSFVQSYGYSFQILANLESLGENFRKFRCPRKKKGWHVQKLWGLSVWASHVALGAYYYVSAPGMVFAINETLEETVNHFLIFKYKKSCDLDDISNERWKT